MDNTVNSYDIYKKYLEILETNLNIKTNLTREEYTVKYEIYGKLSDFTDKTMTPSEIQRLLKFKDIDEFQKYFESSKYVCN